MRKRGRVCRLVKRLTRKGRETLRIEAERETLRLKAEIGKCEGNRQTLDILIEAAKHKRNKAAESRLGMHYNKEADELAKLRAELKRA